MGYLTNSEQIRNDKNLENRLQVVRYTSDFMIEPFKFKNVTKPGYQTPEISIY